MTIELNAVQCREISKLRAAAPDVACVIIGAVAVNHHVELPRSTGDVDLVLALDVPDLQALLLSVGWNQHGTKKQRWTAPDHFTADVLPASLRLINAGTVHFDDDEKEMNLAGFDLLFETAEEHALPHADGSVLVASLPVLVVLKIAAWLDRPYDRKKDLHDLGTILSGALGDDDDRRWDGSVEGAFEEQSPRFMGQEVARIVRTSHLELLREFRDAILPDDSHWSAEIAKGFLAGRRLDPERALRAFFEGVGV